LGQGERPAILGRQILSVEVSWERSIAYPASALFAEQIRGQVIQDIGRRAKYLVFRLTDRWLLIHLRMSGDLSVRPASQARDPYDRVVFNLDRTLYMAFNDTRKFGKVWLVDDPNAVLSGLGPEPFDPQLTDGDFFARLQAHRRQLKPLLLDQSFLAGLGNIYTDEALHLAGLHPLTPSDQLSPEQSQRLLESIRQVLALGIESQGASIDWVYRGGEFQNHFRVYQRTGQPCPTCGTGIVKLTIGQRGTHFCPACQVRPDL
ncbi:MAG: DNA-formamidopyrimidine glycosylase, partial [Anaerolineales bacterium]|nr:DNA-formamidopyrimidine glycosylase [Anaerolineales bacterium]